jgi:hypothetical protein
MSSLDNRRGEVRWPRCAVECLTGDSKARPFNGRVVALCLARGKGPGPSRWSRSRRPQGPDANQQRLNGFFLNPFSDSFGGCKVFALPLNVHSYRPPSFLPARLVQDVQRAMRQSSVSQERPAHRTEKKV